MKSGQSAGLFIIVLLFASGVSVMASDPPHWAGASIDINCTSQCHTLHHAPGGQLTGAATNVALCQTCHKPGGLAEDMAISDSDKAQPGVTGTSHAFDVAAINGTLNTQRPTDAEMDLRVMDSNVVCSTCHDQHASLATMGGTPRISSAEKVFSAGGTGSVTPSGTFTGAKGAWYLVEIAETSPQRRLRYSKDNELTWFEGIAFNYDTAVALDSGVEVTVTTGVAATERWEFYAAYPFLRAPLGDLGNNLCIQCHLDWTTGDPAVYDGSNKSHPVGVAYPAGQAGYHTNAPLDGNGAEQGQGSDDPNPTNDLLLDGSGNIHCLSCHGIHFTDSNTLTVDGP